MLEKLKNELTQYDAKINSVSSNQQQQEYSGTSFFGLDKQYTENFIRSKYQLRLIKIEQELKKTLVI